MQRPVRILVVTLCAVLLGGCAAEPVAAPTPSPTFSTEAEAFAAAEATYRAYVDALNQVDLADPETFEAVYEWTTGEANREGRELFSRMHADAWTVTGESSVARLEPLSAILEAPAIGACLDVSAVQVHDAAGASVVSDTRPNLQAIRIEFVSSPSHTYGLVISNLVGYMPVQPC